MVGNVKEFRAELEVGSFAELEQLEHGEVPGLEARSEDRISPRIAEGTEGRILERAGVEECSCQAMFPVGIGYNIGHLQAIGVRETSIRVGGREPVAGGHGRDAGDLPASDDLLLGPAGTANERFSFPEWQLVNVAGCEAMAHIKGSVAFLPLRMLEPAEAVVILRSEVCIRGVVFGV